MPTWLKRGRRRRRCCSSAKVPEEGERLGELANGEVGSDHGVAEKLIALVGGVEEAASVADDGDGVVSAGSGSGDGGAGSDELSEEVEVVVDGVSEHEGVDLEESGDGLLALALKKV